MLLHIPHSSTTIPPKWQGEFLISQDELESEILTLTDWHTEDLFEYPGSDRLVFPVSRVLVDPERFPNDKDEIMAKVGMGAVYAMTSCGVSLKRMERRADLMAEYYVPHHKMLNDWVDKELKQTSKALLIDCHSFPSVPLPIDLIQNPERPDFFLGTDATHTPKPLIENIVSRLQELGYSVGIDNPYRGTMVPGSMNQDTSGFSSLMIEVNRKLYMNETTGAKGPDYQKIKGIIRALLDIVVTY